MTVVNEAKQTDWWYMPHTKQSFNEWQKKRIQDGKSPYRRDEVVGEYEVRKGRFV